MNLLDLARAARTAPPAKSDEKNEINAVTDQPTTGRVLRFDPARRRRTEQRLTGRPCATCGSVAWTVTARGDAYCGPCASRPAVTTDTRTDSVRGAR